MSIEASPVEDTEPNLKWLDLKTIGIEGQGWTDTECPYDRLPRKAEGMVTNPNVWYRMRNSTGMCAHFRTDAETIHLRWELAFEKWQEANMTKTNFSGFDLYGMHEGEWRWVAATHNFEDSLTPTAVLAKELDGQEREYRLYLPLRNRLLKAELGVPEGHLFEGIPPRSARPVVVYGTSLVHGAYSSRPGLVYPSQIGRKIDHPVLNLGVSGSARMEPEIAELLLELDPEVYVFDTFPNMGVERTRDRLESFLRQIHAGKPEVPIVIVEQYPCTDAWIRPNRQDYIEKNQVIREVAGRLKEEGVMIFSVRGDDLMGKDGEGCVDGVHSNDLAYFRMYEKILPVVQQALEARE